MNILIVPNAFKGSLNAGDVAHCIAQGLKTRTDCGSITTIPLSDGGDGFLDAMIGNVQGVKIECIVKDAVGRNTNAYYALTDDKTAIVEMALASGLTMIPDHLRNPLISSTYGTGQLIQHAINNNANKIIIGLGGSATNDGGVGMAQALGIDFFDLQSNPIQINDLARLHSISMNGLDKKLGSVEFVAACDVNNPLLGRNGATYVYGPQKGATQSDLAHLESNLDQLNEIVIRSLGKKNAEVPGAGAAGGLAYGLITFLNAKLTSGFDLIAEINDLEKHILNSDLVITGEGQFDEQTLHGKAIKGLSDICLKHNKPLIVICGVSQIHENTLIDHGITSVHELVKQSKGIEDSMVNADKYLNQIAAKIAEAL